jgi:hypothetical protein
MNSEPAAERGKGRCKILMKMDGWMDEVYMLIDIIWVCTYLPYCKIPTCLS